VHKPVAIHFNLATKLRNEKGQFFQSEAKPLRKRSFVCSTLNPLHYSLRVLVREDSVMTPGGKKLDRRQMASVKPSLKSG
jgi:hypothetical protein